MTKLLHHRMVGIVGLVALLGAVAGPVSNALAQPGVAPSASPPIEVASPPLEPVPVPDPTPIPPSSAEPTPSSATVDAPSVVPSVAPPVLRPALKALTPPKPITVDDGETGPKSPKTATNFAMWGLLTGPVLALAAAATNSEGLAVLSGLGFFVGPSAGRWYVGEISAGPLAVRGAGAIISAYGFATLICLDNCASRDRDFTGSTIIILAGAGLFVGSTVYDVATAGDRARAYNRSHRGKAGGTNLALAPLLQRNESTLGTTATTTGLMLGGSF